jgi:hypothetical protein
MKMIHFQNNTTFFSVSTTEKTRLKGRRHENIEAQAAAKMELTGIPKEAFTSCFQDLQKRWQQCIDCGGSLKVRNG